MGLGLLGCRADGEDRAPQPPVLAATPVLVATPVPSGADVSAYARGTTVQIRFVQRALQEQAPIRWAAVDSAGAAAAGMPVARFRAVSATVETALRERVIADGQGRLDSLRVELMLLRVRTQGQ